TSRSVGVGVEGTLIPPRGTVWRTTNGGVAWNDALESPYALRAVALPDPASGREIWAAGDLGGVWSSTDGGVTFTDQSGPRRVEPTPDLTAIDFAAPDAGWMVGSHGAARAY